MAINFSDTSDMPMLSYDQANPFLKGVQQSQQIGGDFLKNYMRAQQARYSPEMEKSKAFLSEQQARNYETRQLLDYVRSPAVVAAYAANAPGVRQTVNDMTKRIERNLSSRNYLDYETYGTHNRMTNNFDYSDSNNNQNNSGTKSFSQILGEKLNELSGWVNQKANEFRQGYHQNHIKNQNNDEGYEEYSLANNNQNQDYTQEDLEHTAKKYGMTVAQVKKYLGIS